VCIRVFKEGVVRLKGVLVVTTETWRLEEALQKQLSLTHLLLWKTPFVPQSLVVPHGSRWRDESATNIDFDNECRPTVIFQSRLQRLSIIARQQTIKVDLALQPDEVELDMGYIEPLQELEAKKVEFLPSPSMSTVLWRCECYLDELDNILLVSWSCLLLWRQFPAAA
jgi:hypothetical protein